MSGFVALVGAEELVAAEGSVEAQVAAQGLVAAPAQVAEERFESVALVAELELEAQRLDVSPDRPESVEELVLVVSPDRQLEEGPELELEPGYRGDTPRNSFADRLRCPWNPWNPLNP